MRAFTLYDLSILFSGGLCFLFAAGELVGGKLSWRKLLLFLLSFAEGGILIHGEFMLSRRILSYPAFFQLQLPLYYLLGPLFWLYLREVILDAEMRASLLWHFGTALLVLVLMLPFYGSPDEEKVDLLRYLFFKQASPALPPRYEWLGLLFIGGFAHITIYNLKSARDLRLLWKWQVFQKNASVRIAAMLLLLSLGICFSSLLSILLRLQAGFSFSLGALASLPPLLYLLKERYPAFFKDLGETVKKEKYLRSQLHTIDTQALAEELKTIMQAEALYLEEDLKLPALAERLDLSTHQLSEFFNHYLGVRFSSYINRYRIEEAKRLLITAPQKTVLSIAFEVGFNSKAAFNAAFRKETGESPSAFRKRKLASASQP